MALLKLLYGALFVIVLPVLPALCMRAARHAVPVTVPLPAAAGFAAAGAGCAPLPVTSGGVGNAPLGLQ